MTSRLPAIIILVLLNGVFVAAEFALSHHSRSRRSRLESMTRSGGALGWLARLILVRILPNNQHLRFASQMGVMFCSLMLGWALNNILLILAVAVLHIVLGEVIFRSFKKPGASHSDSAHSTEELRQLVEQSQESGAIEESNADLIDAVFEFSEKSAKEVMTPRMEIVAIPVEASLEEVLKEVEESALSRYPIYEEDIDNILGLILAKDLLHVVTNNHNNDFSVKSIMRPAHVIPGSRGVKDVLADFKKMKEHMAIVLDEYGGTAGIVTMEDLLEEIVGDIMDEYDEHEEQEMKNRAGETLVPGSTHIGELNERFGLEVPDEEYTTIGGYVFGTLGRLPLPGDRVIAGGAIFTVRGMDGRRVDTLAVDLHTLGDRRSIERSE